MRSVFSSIPLSLHSSFLPKLESFCHPFFLFPLLYFFCPSSPLSYRTYIPFFFLSFLPFILPYTSPLIFLYLSSTLLPLPPSLHSPTSLLLPFTNPLPFYLFHIPSLHLPSLLLTFHRDVALLLLALFYFLSFLPSFLLVFLPFFLTSLLFLFLPSRQPSPHLCLSSPSLHLPLLPSLLPSPHLSL